MSLSRFNWLRDLALPLLAALLRVLWLSAWLELVRRWLAPHTAAPILSITLLLCVYLLGALLARLLGGVPREGIARLGQALAGFAFILLALWLSFSGRSYLPWDVQWLRDMVAVIIHTETEFAPSLLVLPALIYLWLQGTLDGRQPLYRDDMWNAFALGFLALVLAALLAPLDGRGQPAGMGAIVFAYFAAGMIAVALAGVETEQRVAARSGQGELALNRFWLVSALSVVGAILLLSLALGALITPDAIARALSWLTIVFDLVGRALYYVLLVVAYIVFSLLEPLLNALQGAQPRQDQSQPAQIPDFQQQLRDVPQGSAALPPAVSAVLPWLGVAGVIVAIGLLFAFALRRRERTSEDDADETRELILSRSLLARQSAELLARLRGARRAGSAAGLSFLALGDESTTRRAIRQAYQALLEAMAVRGQPRQRGQTPSEYQSDVQALAPQAGLAPGALTDAYQQARYAAQAPSDGQVKAAQQAWDDIQAAFVNKDDSKL